MRKPGIQIFRLVLLALTLVGAFCLGALATSNPAVQSLIVRGGYGGVFLFSIINGFNVVVPLVTASFIPALTEAGLNPYALVFVMSIGMTFADMVSFFLARAGHAHLTREEHRVMKRVQRAERTWHWLPLLILALWAAAAPLPNEVILVPLGLMGYRTVRVLPIVFAGNFIFNVVVGLGLVSIFSSLGA